MILTIAIPTFNREKELALKLFKINDIIKEENSSSIELIVANNCSSDNTLKILKDFELKKNNFLKFAAINNSNNLGFDGNIEILYKNATGKYIWFLSDDDDFTDDTIAIIIETLINNNISLLVLNSFNYPFKREELRSIVPYLNLDEKINIKTGEICLITNENERLFAVLAASQISSCVVRKDLNLPIDVEFGGGLMHCQIANLLLIKNPTYLITSLPLIKPSPKTYISTWFLESTIFGIRKLYKWEKMEFSKKNADLVSINTAKLGLSMLIKRYSSAGRVNYPVVNELLKEKLQTYYSESYFLLEEHFMLALKSENSKIKIIYLFIKYFNIIKIHLIVFFKKYIKLILKCFRY
jgi:glycosyltransferase involved in cell wall biosynthesis